MEYWFWNNYLMRKKLLIDMSLTGRIKRGINNILWIVFIWLGKHFCFFEKEEKV